MMGTRSAHPFSPRALPRAACTRTAIPDQNTCTACTNAVRNRTSDTSHPPSFPAARCRTARTVTRRASPADSPGVGQARGPTSAGRSCVLAAVFAPASANPSPWIPSRGLDIHADGISPHYPPKHVPVFSTQSALPGKSRAVGTQYGVLSTHYSAGSV